MENKFKFALLAVLALGIFTFGCIGGNGNPVATGAADGDFKSLNVRGGPSIMSGPVTMTGTVNMTGDVTVTGYVNSTPGAATVGTAALIDKNVTTGKIQDSGITAAKMAANSVATASIIDANVTDAKLSSTFAKTSAASRLQAFNTTISAGNTSKTFTFATAFGGVPVVTFSLGAANVPVNTSYYVSAITATNFTITANNPVTNDMLVYGMAMGAS